MHGIERVVGGVRVGALAVLAACAAPMTQMGSLSKDMVAAEQEKQQEFALRSQLQQQAHLTDVAFPLLRSGVPLCGKMVARRAGLSFANAWDYKKDWQPAARRIGLGDTVSVLHVAAGSGAERAGLKAGDRILAVDDEEVVFGQGGTEAVSKRLGKLEASDAPSVRITYLRDSTKATVEVPLDSACAFDVAAETDQVLNAWADGRNVVVTSAMMRFVGSDDELATVVAHEIAHNAMGHINAKKKNALFGALLGAVADVALAGGGYNSGGAFTREGAEAGAMVFSQDFEREADYVGLYIIALGGRPITEAPKLWRRMAAELPGNIKFASSHPTTAERFVRLEQWIAEIQGKEARGEPLRPEMKPQR